MNTIVAKVRSIQGPEMLPNNIKKFYVALDDGATIITFSQRCATELLKGLDTDIEFVIDGPIDVNNAPRILKATKDGKVLYDREAGKAAFEAKQGTPLPTLGTLGPAQADHYYQDETTRAVEFAVNYLTEWNAAVVAATGQPMPQDLFAAKLIDLSTIIHEQIMELRKPDEPAQADTEAKEFASNLASGPWTT